MQEIKAAKKELSMKRKIYETVTNVNFTIKAAWKSLKGDSVLSADAEKTIAHLQNDIQAKIANIQTGIKLANKYIEEKDLKRAAKIKISMEEISKQDEVIKLPVSENSFSYLKM